jgi:hypothetical protein
MPFKRSPRFAGGGGTGIVVTSVNGRSVIDLGVGVETGAGGVDTGVVFVTGGVVVTGGAVTGGAVTGGVGTSIVEG